MDDIKLSNFNSNSKDEVVFTEDRIAPVSYTHLRAHET